MVAVMVAGLVLGSVAAGQTGQEKQPPAAAAQPASDLADALARRLGNDLHVKTVVGEPMKVGSVTLIPIMMIDVNFGGLGMAAPANPAAVPNPSAAKAPPTPAATTPNPAAVPTPNPGKAPPNLAPATPPNPAPGADGFFMSGEARPLGFVAITRKGTRFISIAGAAKTPAK